MCTAGVLSVCCAHIVVNMQLVQCSSSQPQLTRQQTMQKVLARTCPRVPSLADSAPHFLCPRQLLSFRTIRAAASTSAVEVPESVVALNPPGKSWDKVEQWVVFSDLHVSVRSLDVCLEVLRKVKHEATKRKAGILFLGKHSLLLCKLCSSCSHFWHIRSRLAAA